jgi:phosphoglycolate phosphatase-like HAD superfamily hydrolase
MKRTPLALGACLLTCGLVAAGCRAPSRDAPPSRDAAPSTAAGGDPLPSWNDGAVKTAIVGFVQRTTTDSSADLVPADERIAVFDNDGTLWSEQPVYFQLAFALDRVKTLAAGHPEWKTTQPFKGVLEGDLQSALAGGESALLQIVAATHGNTTVDEFQQAVATWLDTARHPRFDRPYTDLVFQPMLELLGYLRANGFKTYVVSGGGIDFMRPWMQRAYGIPPEQVVGSRVKVKYEVRNGQPTLVRVAELEFNDDKAGKPVGIYQAIGRRPILAFGNSDGDFEMIEWVTTGAGPRLGAIVRHTDADREWAYDRDSHIGRLARGLDEAPARGWFVVDMKRDWKVVYPHQR